MPFESTGKIDTTDPFSVIRDPNEGESAAFYIDRDVQAPCIEAIFQQFLDDGGRALNDLPGRDAAHYVV
jgi:hypothetical protein